MSTHVREAFVTLPRCRSSSVRFERSRGHLSFAGSTFVQRRAADQPVRSARLWRLRELPEATSSHRCGDDAPSAASGYDRGSVHDETQPPPQRYGIVASDTLRAGPEFRTEIR